MGSPSSSGDTLLDRADWPDWAKADPQVAYVTADGRVYRLSTEAECQRARECPDEQWIRDSKTGEYVSYRDARPWWLRRPDDPAPRRAIQMHRALRAVTSHRQTAPENTVPRRMPPARPSARRPAARRAQGARSSQDPGSEGDSEPPPAEAAPAEVVPFPRRRRGFPGSRRAAIYRYACLSAEARGAVVE